MDINKQINYWVDGSDEDIETAGLLIRKKKILNGLFFCHLACEKILKAHFVKIEKATPPKTHNLVYLCELIKINIQDEEKLLLSILTKYQIEGRYPEYIPDIPPVKKAKEYLKKTKDLVKCLKKKL